MKTILITGGSGFIGSYLIPQLEKDHTVISLDIKENIDITQFDQLSNINNIDYIIHLAAIASPPLCDKNPKQAFDVNILGTYNILRLATKLDIKKFILLSSAHVYGTSPKYIPTHETHPYFLQDNYTTTKLIDESLCHLFYDNYNLSYITLRLFNTYGIGQPLGYFIPDMLNKSLNGKIHLKGSNVTKDFIYIDDVIDAIIKSIKSDYIGELNVGSGIETSLGYVASTIASRMNVSYTSEPTGESRMCADISRIRKMLDWKPYTSFDVGLNETIDKFKVNNIDRLQINIT